MIEKIRYETEAERISLIQAKRLENKSLIFDVNFGEIDPNLEKFLFFETTLSDTFKEKINEIITKAGAILSNVSKI